MLINNVEKSVSRSVVSNSRKHVSDVVNWGQGAQKLRMLAAAFRPEFSSHHSHWRVDNDL